MKEFINNHKLIFGLSVLIFFYFTLLFLNAYYWHFTFVLIGVLQEMATIPVMVFEIVLLLISVKSFVSTKFSFRQYPFYSLLVLSISVLVTWGSFFYLTNVTD